MYREQGLPLTVVHLAAVIGAGDPTPTMEIRRAVEGRLPALVGADKTFTYVHVRDAAEAIVQALLRDITVGRAYLIGNQRATTREYFEMIGELAGVSVPSWNLPESVILPFARAFEQLSHWTGARPPVPVDVSPDHGGGIAALQLEGAGAGARHAVPPASFGAARGRRGDPRILRAHRITR